MPTKKKQTLYVVVPKFGDTSDPVTERGLADAYRRAASEWGAEDIKVYRLEPVDFRLAVVVPKPKKVSS